MLIIIFADGKALNIIFRPSTYLISLPLYTLSFFKIRVSPRQKEKISNNGEYLPISKFTHHPTNKKPHECGDNSTMNISHL